MKCLWLLLLAFGVAHVDADGTRGRNLGQRYDHRS